MKGTAFSPHEGIYIQHLATTQKNNMAVQHYHDAYEIYLLLDGKRYTYFDNNCFTLQRGDLVLFKPFEIHYSESREVDYYERYVLNFQPDMLQGVLSKEELYFLLGKFSSGVMHLTEEQTVLICDYFKRIEEYNGQGGFLTEKLKCFEVVQLFMKLLQFAERAEQICGEQIEAQIVSAIQYIKEHYRENVTVEDIAAAAHMSKYHFCRKFHEITGATAIEYLHNVRLTKVHYLLQNTKLSLGEIALETGFQSADSMSRVFRKNYGMSPRTFRSIQEEK